MRTKNAEALEPPGLGEVWLWACPSVHTYPAPTRGAREEERRATATPPGARVMGKCKQMRIKVMRTSNFIPEDANQLQESKPRKGQLQKANEKPRPAL